MRLTADIVYVICGVLLLFIPFKDRKTQRSEREQWSMAVMGAAWFVMGGIQLTRDSGWWILTPGIEHTANFALVVISCGQLIAALAWWYSAWPRIQKRMQLADTKQPTTALMPSSANRKTCAYCGRENDKSVTHCMECGTEKFKGEVSPSRPAQAI